VKRAAKLPAEWSPHRDWKFGKQFILKARLRHLIPRVSCVAEPRNQGELGPGAGSLTKGSSVPRGAVSIPARLRLLNLKSSLRCKPAVSGMLGPWVRSRSEPHGKPVPHTPHSRVRTVCLECKTRLGSRGQFLTFRAIGKQLGLVKTSKAGLDTVDFENRLPSVTLTCFLPTWGILLYRRGY
jgi:hypothetical protein